MNNDKLGFFAKLAVVLLAAMLLAYLFFKYLFLYLLPFFFAWGVALLIRPVADFFSRLTHIPKRIISPILTCVALGGVITLICLAVYSIASEAIEFLSSFSENGEAQKIVQIITAPFSLLGQLPKEVGDKLYSALYELAIRTATGLASGLADGVKRLPALFIGIVVSLVLSVFFGADLDGVQQGIMAALPHSVRNKLPKLKSIVLSVGANYFRSYTLLMLITFAILLVGFLILGVNYALLLSLLTALLDLLPVLGVGMVLLPMSIYNFLSGNTFLGVGLLILLAVILVVRQFAEPRIVGRSLGVHPVASLMLIYLGYSLFGIPGLIILPALGAILLRKPEEPSEQDPDAGSA